MCAMSSSTQALLSAVLITTTVTTIARPQPHATAKRLFYASPTRLMAAPTWPDAHCPYWYCGRLNLLTVPVKLVLSSKSPYLPLLPPPIYRLGPCCQSLLSLALMVMRKLFGQKTPKSAKTPQGAREIANPAVPTQTDVCRWYFVSSYSL